MNKNYLPFYNSLNEKEKTFWLECTKEELIDHLIANIKNGETLLNRIDKAIKYIKEHEEKQFAYNFEYGLRDNEIEELLEILGKKE